MRAVCGPIAAPCLSFLLRRRLLALSRTLFPPFLASSSLPFSYEEVNPKKYARCGFCFYCTCESFLSNGEESGRRALTFNRVEFYGLSAYHLPLLSTSSSRTRGMVLKSRRGRPRLDRRNAAKHIEYDALASSSLPDNSSESLHTRSLELPDKTSFRIGGGDGEFDRICRSLGLSGPDDFTIPASAYQYTKIRSSSDRLPNSRLNRLDGTWVDGVKEEEDREAEDEVLERVRESVKIRGSTELPNYETVELSGNGILGGCSGGGGGVGGGIKGVRPPLVKPPPFMRPPVHDNASTTWDIFRDLVVDQEGNDSPSDDNDGDEDESNMGVVEREEAGCTGRLDESIAFSTSADDDSSSTATDPYISPNGRPKPTIYNWEKGALLGRGSFGSVYEGFSGDGGFFAVKEVSLLDQDNQGQQSIIQLQQEIALLSQFEHENIVQYYGTEKTESHLFIFLELVTKGSLMKLYQTYHLRDSQVSAYTRQILHGLKYLHDQNVVHRDIKCANILVHASGAVKLADFGLAKATKMNDIKSCKGTAFWMAPEVVNRKNQGYGHPADIWSFGCTVLEMLTGKIPYSEFDNPMSALFKIGSGMLPMVPDSLSIDARDLVLQCLQPNPHDRPSAAQLLEHPFVKRSLLPTSSGPQLPCSSGSRK